MKNFTAGERGASGSPGAGRRGAGNGSVYVSVIVPVYNERESIPPLLEQLDAALRRLDRPSEIILVDDGSRDGTWEQIRNLRSTYSRLCAIRFSRNFGQTAAMMAGIRRSRGEIVVTMDGDLQNDPADIPSLIARIEDGNEIVSGWRRRRRDRFLSRRMPSITANAIIRRITGTTIHDQGCALKAYRGTVLRSIALYSEFHRFIVPLAQMGGFRVAEVETNHRAREHGRSKYGIARTFRVLADMVTLVMITRYSDRVLAWFLSFAVIPLLLGLATLAWTVRGVIDLEEAGLLVPMGATVLLFQSVVAIVCQALIAERIRHTAPEENRSGNRFLAAEIDASDGSVRPLLIRKNRAVPLGAPRNSGVA